MAEPSEVGKSQVGGEDQGEAKGNESKSKERKPKRKEQVAEVDSTGGRPARKRKQVERFKEEPVKEVKEPAISEHGKGIKLEDIPKVAKRFQKTKRSENEAFANLHKILFGRPGRKHENIKKSILQFSGVVYSDQTLEAEQKKLLEKLSKMTVTDLKQMCYLLDMFTGGSKEEVVTRLKDFLMKPSETIRTKAKSVPKEKKEKADNHAQESKESAESASAESNSEGEESESDHKPAKKKQKKKNGKLPEGDDGATASEKTSEPEESEMAKEDNKTSKHDKKDPSDDDIVAQLDILINHAKKENQDPSARQLREQLEQHFGVSMGARKKFVAEQAAEIYKKLG